MEESYATIEDSAEGPVIEAPRRGRPPKDRTPAAPVNAGPSLVIPDDKYEDGVITEDNSERRHWFLWFVKVVDEGR